MSDMLREILSAQASAPESLALGGGRPDKGHCRIFWLFGRLFCTPTTLFPLPDVPLNKRLKLKASVEVTVTFQMRIPFFFPLLVGKPFVLAQFSPRRREGGPKAIPNLQTLELWY